LKPLSAIADLTLSKSHLDLSTLKVTCLVLTSALILSFSTNCRVPSAFRTLAVHPIGQVMPGTSSTTWARLALFAAGAVLAADVELVAAGVDLPAFDSHPTRTGPASNNKVQPRITIL